MAYAFNRGVNRGLFSNEAGQGSAPIAHAAARSKHPASEGMVAILEPFIDTVVICTLTGLALLTSGVWHEKEVNEFQLADVYVLSGAWTEEDEQQRSQLYSFYNEGGELPLFNGSLNVAGGTAQENVTLLHARSIAEQVEFTLQEQPMTAQITVSEGRMIDLPGGTSGPWAEFDAQCATDGPGFQTRIPRRLGSVHRLHWPLAICLFDGHQLVVLWRSGSDLSSGVEIRRGLSGALRPGLFPCGGSGHDADLDILRHCHCADDPAQPDRHTHAAQGHEANTGFLLGGIQVITPHTTQVRTAIAAYFCKHPAR